MRIEFLKDHGAHRAGAVVDQPGGVADALIRRGIARPAGDGDSPPARKPKAKKKSR